MHTQTAGLDMDILLADIGNTNTRLALADASGLCRDTLASHPNANWNNFDEMLESYLRELSAPRIKACCVAVAGPVRERAAHLHIPWHIDAANVERVSGAERVELVNDLCALGLALLDLAPTPVCDADGALRNGQRLVVGIGTFFNVCPARVYGSWLGVLEAEAGNTHLPASVRDLLRTEIGDAAEDFRSVGDCFGGHGAAVIVRAVAGMELNQDEAMRSLCAQDGPDAGRAGRIFAKALGLLTRNLICAYLPYDGVIFAGSVARGVFGSTAATAFIEEYQRDWTGTPLGVVDSRNVPVSLIEDDAAALLGCLRWVRKMCG